MDAEMICVTNLVVNLKKSQIVPWIKKDKIMKVSHVSYHVLNSISNLMSDN